jgi:hypothetical protein
MTGKCINRLERGCRVWAQAGFRDHGYENVSVPPMTGGVVISTSRQYLTVDLMLYTVKWDTGQQSVHYPKELCSLGTARSLTEFEDSIMAEADHAEIILGPSGGDRGAKIFLKSGDWIDGMYGLKPKLEAANILIETKRLPRKGKSI